MPVWMRTADHVLVLSTPRLTRAHTRPHFAMTLPRAYLQPGGEREWKVDSENISARSAIFFQKGLF